MLFKATMLWGFVIVTIENSYRPENWEKRCTCEVRVVVECGLLFGTKPLKVTAREEHGTSASFSTKFCQNGATLGVLEDPYHKLQNTYFYFCR